MSGRGNTSRVYIGNLPEDIARRELEDLFYKFGRIKDIDIKYGRTSNGTAYAFLEFEDPRDAEEAVDRRDGYKFAGVKLRVEFTGERRPKKNRNRSHGPIKRTLHRVSVSGLPSSASWQDLKDHMRQAGPVGYANIEGTRGIVEYETREDKERAIRKLDGSEFKNIFHRCTIRVRSSRGEGQYRSDSVSRSSRSNGRSSHSRSYTRSPSPASDRGARHRHASRYSRSASRDPPPSHKGRSYDRSISSRSRARSNYSRHSYASNDSAARSHRSVNSYHSHSPHDSPHSKSSAHSHHSEKSPAIAKDSVPLYEENEAKMNGSSKEKRDEGASGLAYSEEEERSRGTPSVHSSASEGHA